jgi:hypothetical protein
MQACMLTINFTIFGFRAFLSVTGSQVIQFRFGSPGVFLVSRHIVRVRKS